MGASRSPPAELYLPCVLSIAKHAIIEHNDRQRHVVADGCGAGAWALRKSARPLSRKPGLNRRRGRLGTRRQARLLAAKCIRWKLCYASMSSLRGGQSVDEAGHRTLPRRDAVIRRMEVPDG